jgi:hypothetical protein
MRICVYCASSERIDPRYFEATERFALDCVQSNVEVVYGGGSSGLMGRLADVMIAHGGKIKGIMPKFMNDVEWAHKLVADMEFTETMHERKAKFLIGIDGIVTLPGGTGTLEEFLEAFTLKRLGQFSKPMIVLNTNGYYDPLKLVLQRCVDEQFMLDKHMEMCTFVDQPEEIIPAIQAAGDWNEDALRFARLT